VRGSRLAQGLQPGDPLHLHSPKDDVESDGPVDLLPLDEELRRLEQFWKALQEADYIAAFA
jgi:hypothetical protein